jgi:hypothetical protein
VPPRRSFALTGKSVRLDPLTHAVRSDLADVRLADRVFAPHYAAPREMTLAVAAPLRVDAAADAATLGQLHVGDRFDVLEFAGGNAWGSAPSLGLVGYIDAGSLGIQ